MLRKIYSSKRHIIFWVIYIGYALIYQKIAYPNDVYPWPVPLFHFSSFAVVFYFTYFASNLFFKNKKRLCGTILLYFLLGIALSFGIQFVKNYYFLEQKARYFLNYLLIFGEDFLIITFALFFSLIEFTERVNQTNVANLKVQNEKTLLFNKSKKHKIALIKMLDEIIEEDESPEIVADLKEFRHLVNFLINSTHKSLISIDLEIENLKRYINLYHLRSGKTDIFKLNIEGNNSNWQIPHKSILTLVENAIQHGDLDYPVLIKIDFEPDAAKILIRNKVGNKKDVFFSNNIGLSNLKARFELHLWGRFRFEVDGEGEWFEVVVELYRLDK